MQRYKHSRKRHYIMRKAWQRSIRNVNVGIAADMLSHKRLRDTAIGAADEVLLAVEKQVC